MITTPRRTPYGHQDSDNPLHYPHRDHPAHRQRIYTAVHPWAQRGPRAAIPFGDPEGRDPAFDLSYRVWSRSPDGLDPIRATFNASLPNARSTPDVTDETLVYEDDAVRVIAFIDASRDLAVLVSCGTEQCADIETVILLANFAWRNLKDTLDAPSSAKGGTP